jgi:hypothetical protein
MSLFTTNIGINTETPRGTVDAVTSGSGSTASSLANGLIVEHGRSARDQSGISILSNSLSTGNIFFGDKDNNKAGAIRYNHYLDKFFIYANNRGIADFSGSALNVNGVVKCNSLECLSGVTLNDSFNCNDKATFNNNSATVENINLDVPSGTTVKNVLTISQNNVHQGGLHFYYGDYGGSGIISLMNERFGMKVKSASINDHAIEPCTTGGLNKDNAVDLGRSNNRFDDIYATNGSIQTSDKNEKQNIKKLLKAEKKVAVAAKDLLRKFKWKDAVKDKGTEARTHFGIIAQDLQAAFEAEGLDANDYGMFTSNTWWSHNGTIYHEEANAPEGATEHTRLGVRYSELLAFIIAGI